MNIDKINIQNFTVFKDIDIVFNKGINLIIGENGTGKTHLLKVLYIGCQQIKSKTPSDNIFYKYFQVDNNALFKNIKNGNPKIMLETDCISVETEITNKIISSTKTSAKDYSSTNATFIPSKDILTHSRGFIALSHKFNVPFDNTYIDIINQSLLPNLREIPQLGKNILPKLKKIIGGKVIVENDTFYIQKTNGSKIKFSVEAEGVKKIAILWQLIMNESITKDSILFWDEAEANINPSLYKDIATILLELSRQGVQIFLATHNYNFAKYIDVLSTDNDNISYTSFYKTKDNNVTYESEEKFNYLTKNSLRDDNINLYDEELKKGFKK